MHWVCGRTGRRAVGLGCALAIAGAAAAQPPAGQAVPPTLPLTQLEQRALAADLDNRTFSLTFARPVPVKDLLLLLVRGTTLSIIPDPAIGGSFIGELKNVTVRQALRLILPPLGLDFMVVDGGFIRVFKRQPETRLFDVNYVATTRSGAATVGTSGTSADPSFARVTSRTGGDLFDDLTAGVKGLLSERATFNLDRKAGLLQVTDFPERLDRIALYLDTVSDRAHRQVRIDARVVDVELDAAHASGLDWAPLTGPRDLGHLLAALAAQGTLSVLASPRLMTLNNQPAIVRAATRAAASDDKNAAPASGAVTISVTPQIAPDGFVMLSLSPMVAVQEGGRGNRPGATAVREADTLARVADGQTIVVSGFPRDREVRERRNSGVHGGWFGRTTVVTRKRIETVILLTPTIVPEAVAP